MTKETMRQDILEKRLSLAEDKFQNLSEIIQDRLIKSPYWPKKGRVGLYAAVKNEVATSKLFKMALEQGLHVYFPRVEQGIKFYEVNGPDDLKRGSWSILEPNTNCEPLEAELDLLVVPGIAFTAAGYRIGYGKGFYDRFLEGLPKQTETVALAFDFQVIPDFPADETDQPLKVVLTERNLYKSETA